MYKLAFFHISHKKKKGRNVTVTSLKTKVSSYCYCRKVISPFFAHDLLIDGQAKSTAGVS